MSSGNNQLMEELKRKAPFLHNLKTIFEYKYMGKADIGKHCLLLLS